jgi:hypothetical protein
MIHLRSLGGTMATDPSVLWKNISATHLPTCACVYCSQTVAAITGHLSYGDGSPVPPPTDEEGGPILPGPPPAPLQPSEEPHKADEPKTEVSSEEHKHRFLGKK